MAFSETEVNKVGRPLRFQSEEELRNKIIEYFQERERLGLLPTISSLAIYLDTYRMMLIRYSQKDKFWSTIKWAKEVIQSHLEDAMLDPNRKNIVGVIFNAKNNWGWVDKTEIDQTTKATVVMDKIKIDGKSVEFDVGDKTTKPNADD